MQLGVIGLGTMGANLARNAARNGAKVAVYNRTAEKTNEFMAAHGSEGDFVACKSLEEMRDALEPPRPILIMVKAGDAVDAVIESLTPLLDKGDILIDGGNSHFPDTDRRFQSLSDQGFQFLGMGVSGGEDGALNGPSMMPGGSVEAWKSLEPLLTAMAASDGAKGKCVTLIGPGSSGHFVKMVHNGIEYGVMQLIAETYDMLKSEAGYTNKQLAELFTEWNKSEDLQSYLVEITAKIFTKRDPEADAHVLDLIKDVAGQKGTGKWTTEAAMNLGVAIPTINAAVDARIVSGSVEMRKSHRDTPEELGPLSKDPEKLVARARAALELSIICAYSQGFEMMRVASAEYGWNLNLGEIARIWRGGCIIRSAFLQKMQQAFAGNQSGEIIKRFTEDRQNEWRRAIALGTRRGIPLPAMTASLSYFDALRREKLPQNLIQAQRDFFGAHTYERVDREGTFHTEWQ